eukprot:GEMP01032014.1.p1 GENE.GEMP01032014.1~~GEMP01032014.1.p1  ORF type:complete len:379 (+),score=113.18 GEMP01032014.1:84-1220(+)
MICLPSSDAQRRCRACHVVLRDHHVNFFKEDSRGRHRYEDLRRRLDIRPNARVEATVCGDAPAVVRFRHDYLGDAMCQVLIASLPQWPRVFDLSSQGMKNSAGLLLTQRLAQDPPTQPLEFDLSCNALSKLAGIALLVTILDCPFLYHVELSRTMVPTDLRLQIQDALLRNRQRHIGLATRVEEVRNANEVMASSVVANSPARRRHEEDTGDVAVADTDHPTASVRGSNGDGDTAGDGVALLLAGPPSRRNITSESTPAPHPTRRLIGQITLSEARALTQSGGVPTPVNGELTTGRKVNSERGQRATEGTLDDDGEQRNNEEDPLEVNSANGERGQLAAENDANDDCKTEEVLTESMLLADPLYMLLEETLQAAEDED